MVPSFVNFARQHVALRWGLIIVVAWTLIALLAPVISPYSPTQPHPGEILLPPSAKYWFGTDKDGFDVFSRVIWAPRTDLGIAVTSTALSVLIGIPLGALAGYFGGRGGLLGLGSEWFMRAVDVSRAFPVFVFALVLVGVLGTSIPNVIIALTFANAPVFIWLTRSEVLSVREKPFVEAARCSGNSELQIAFLHVLPNSLASPLTQLSIVLGFSILLTAGLSFLGAGVRVPTPEWGLMVARGASTMIIGKWWTALFPGLALGIAVFGFALVGDGLRIYLDPRQRRQIEKSFQSDIENAPADVQPVATVADEVEASNRSRDVA
ncbi:MAG TPA: ABC transporter permease [Anaerolineae bacterium]|nr:ABC transporter permease [Anaerolineae bacterium]